MFEIEAPADREELLRSLKRLHGEILAAMGTLQPGVFLAPQGKFWSPADHLRHLVRSIRPLAKALSLPRWILLLRFGVTGRKPASFAEVRDLYRGELAAGAQAGPYGPPPREPGGDDDPWRALVLDRFERVGQDLDRVLAGWTDRSLDRYRLPHPLLGQMTIREMLYFTLYHNQHHARRVFERLAMEERP